MLSIRFLIYITCTTLACLCQSIGKQVPLYEWTFDEPLGTALTSARSSDSASLAWSDSFDASVTDGAGNYVVTRSPDGSSNAFVEIASITADDLPGRVWLVLEVTSWFFKGSRASETMRIGFSSTVHNRKPHVAAQIKLARVDEGRVVVTGEAFGDGAVSSDVVSSFNTTQNEPITFVLEFDKQKERFELFYKLLDGPYLSLGSGKISPERNANFLRLGFTGYFNGSGENLSIDRIAVTEYNPMR